MSTYYAGYPTQFYGGTPFVYTPAAGNPIKQFTGGVIFAASPTALQNTNLFDKTFGCLTLPYTAYRAGRSGAGVQNISDENTGVQKAISTGKFSSMTAGQYVLMTFTSQLAGLTTTVLTFPSNSYHKSQNKNFGYVDTWLHSKIGGWYYINGKLISWTMSRDNVNVEPASTYAKPGRLTLMETGAKALVTGYASRNN